uniref:Uncharacterized protein n=1 Tax=Strongyloides papillosus TaxID=174720 RepID=A0A0N5BH03_STREA
MSAQNYKTQTKAGPYDYNLIPDFPEDHAFELETTTKAPKRTKKRTTTRKPRRRRTTKRIKIPNTKLPIKCRYFPYDRECRRLLGYNRPY